VMSFAVNQRTNEFGLRMALGANATRILTGVLKTGGWQVALGLMGGLGLSYALAKLMAAGIQGTLFNVTPSDPLTFWSVGALVAVVALGATLVPARRAMRVDPMVALRGE